MTCRQRNDFESADGRALIRVGSWRNGRRKGKVYLMNKERE